MNDLVTMNKNYLQIFKNKIKRMDCTPLMISEDSDNMYAYVKTQRRELYPYVLIFNKKAEMIQETSGLAVNPLDKKVIYSSMED